MPTISLAPYTIRVRRRKEKDFLPLGQLDVGYDAFDLFQRFFDVLKTRLDRTSKTLFRRIRFERYPRNRVLEGILETGEYGYEAMLVDVDVDPNKITHRRRVTEAELLPFYFRLDIPRRANQGYLILQRFGSLGIKAALEEALARFFSRTPYIVEINPLVPEQVIEKWIRPTNVRRLRLVSFELPKTIDEAFQLGDSKEVYAELVIRPKKGHKFPLPGWLKRRGGEGFIELKDAQKEIKKLRHDLDGIFPLDTLKFEVSVAGKTRTVDVTDPGNLVAYHDVTAAVQPLDKNGHPAWDKIREEARNLAKDLDDTVRRLGVGGSSPSAVPAGMQPLPAAIEQLEIDRKAG